ncbi:hypothetical protein [Pseudomonas salomonii]|uniref:Uncharacterized protein n=1 Tax=Pseudomonas salomonii TaxID=191391 RepID=A0A1H3SPN8_9PSED|nr:hypothetical protein [Pseudomonas salomonii]SDZ39511.1 hypothetical protein SAMN05216247_109326 [Pseudomonas salomonii]
MAKITITLEDRHQGNGKPSVTVDMTGVAAPPLDAPRQTEAMRLSYKLFDLIVSEKMLGTIPACRWQSSNTTLH